MSTVSTISVQCGEEIRAIYCHFDGYPEHHYPILTNFYNTQQLAEKLVSLGDMSVLSISCECPEGHTFKAQKKGFCVYYGRDRGEAKTEYKTYQSFDKIKNNYSYVYHWNGEKWICFHSGSEITSICEAGNYESRI